MARLILSWLNEEVQLSKEIISLSEDFSNGYLLGELLHAYNQQQHFEKFIDKDTPDAKIRNFCLLEPTMRQVGVHFNSKVAFDVMNLKPGAMKTLLYELKTVLDNVKEMSMDAEGHKKCNIMQVIRPGKPLYDKTMSSTFENAIRAMVDNPNDVLFRKKQKEFDNMSKSFKDSVSSAHSLQLDDIALEIRRNKELTKQRKKHEKEFQETWNEINMEQWRTNQVVARERRNLQTIVDNRLTARKNQLKKQEVLNAREKAIAGIDEFEERLQSMRHKDDPAENALSIDVRTAGGEEGTGIPQLSYMNEETLRDGMVRNQKIMKERNEKLRLRCLEHDKRRKRFVRLRESHHSNNLHAEAEKEILEQVLVTSQIEDVEKFAKLRFMSLGSLMSQNQENYNNITSLLSKKTTEDSEKCSARMATLENDWVVQHHMDAQVTRQEVAEEAASSARRVDVEEIAEREFARILDLVDWVVNVRALGVYEECPTLSQVQEGAGSSSMNVLPDVLMRDVKAMFTSECVSIPDALPVMNPTNVYESYPFSLSWRPLSTKSDWLYEDAFRAPKYMKNSEEGEGGNLDQADSRMAAYLNSEDSKKFYKTVSSFQPKPVQSDESDGKKDKKKDTKKEKDSKKGGKKGKEEEVVETGPKVVPPQWITATPADCLLGETVVSLRCVADPIPDHPKVPENIPSQQIRVVLCGTSINMKQKVAQSLTAELGIVNIVVEDLLSGALQRGQALDADSCSSEYDKLAYDIHQNALDGHSATDDDYVQLLVEAIASLEQNGKGFVISDFPNTDQQAFKLVTALSGVDYNQHRPQPKDKVSPVLTATAREDIVFDYNQCGFDKFFFISTPHLSVIKNRVTMRKDLTSGEVVSISDEVNSIETLAEIVTPEHPMDTLSFLLSHGAQALIPVVEFAARLGIASHVVVDDDKDSATVANKILGILQPSEEITPNATTEAQENNAEIENEIENEEKENNETVEDTNDRANKEPPEEEMVQETESPAVEVREGVLPRYLARVLDEMWTSGEQAVAETSWQFFSGLRDARYQMIQRRGGIRHSVLRSLLRRDNKQDLFDEFRQKFNSFDIDFRFDRDLINELCLRTLELRDQFWSISEQRSSEANDIIDKVSTDSSVRVLIHKCECEAAQLLQSYCSLFVSGLNVLFDFMRSVSSFDTKKCMDQTLESVDPIPPDFLDNMGTEEEISRAKDKGKDKGKGASSTSRAAIACLVLWPGMEQSVPEPIAPLEEEPSKKKGKDKKDTEEPLTPFLASQQKALSFCSDWSRDTFSVDPEVYGEDESLCSAIEKAVWHEADRFQFMMEHVASMVADQTRWLLEQEASILDCMRKLVEKRKITELSTAERLCEMIYQCIEDNEPIKSQWQIAPDAIVVREDRLVYPPPVIVETTPMNDFYVSRLNGEQSFLASDMLSKLKFGDNLILKQDLLEWLHCCNSGIGGVACNISPSDAMYSLSLPSRWFEEHDEVIEKVYTQRSVCGTFEEKGTAHVDEVLENMAKFGNEQASTNSNITQQKDDSNSTQETKDSTE